MLVGYALYVLSVISLMLLVLGYVSAFWANEALPSPGFYWTWALVFALFVLVVIGASVLVKVAVFACLLFTAWLWARDLKERPR